MAQGRVVFDGTPDQLTADAVQEIYGSDRHGAGIDETMTSTTINIPQAVVANSASRPAPYRPLAAAEA